MPDAAGGHPATSPLALPIVATPSDDQLIASARAGDGFAGTRLWNRHETAAAAAAAATPGSADVEFVVEAAASRFSGAILAADAPVGAIRPHVLAAVREAAAAADGRGGTTADHAPALLAPPEWYRAELPRGLDDGEAIAVAYTSLGTAAQEALWLAEIDGLPPVELAAELGLSPVETEGLVATAQEGLRSAWVRQSSAAAAPDAPCDGVLAEIGAPGTGGRRIPGRVRSHVDACDGCRAAALPAAELAHRLVGLLPLLVLGSAAGTGFLEATRAGAAAGALAPVPALAGGRAAFTAVTAGALAGTGAGASTVPAQVASATATGPSTGLTSTISHLGRAIGSLPRAALVATAATLAAAAAAVVLVAAISGGTPSLASLDSSVSAGAGGADISALPPGMAPPEIIATDVPADPVPDDGSDPEPPNGAAPDAPDAAVPPADGDAPGTAEPDPTPDAAAPPAPEPGTPPVAAPDEGVTAPVADPQPGPGLGFAIGEPGEAGWRALTVTGPPGAEFTIFDRGDVLLQGTLDATGSASFAIRGSVTGLTIGYSSSSVTAGGAGPTDGLSLKSTAPKSKGADRRILETD